MSGERDVNEGDFVGGSERSRYVVFNPGSHPAPRWLAAELASRSQLDSYWTTFQLAEDEVVTHLLRALRVDPSNRVLPAALPRKRLRRSGAWIDGVSAALMALGMPRVRNRLLRTRNERSARSLKRYLLRAMAGDGRPAGLVLPTGTATGLEAWCFDNGVPYVLYTPLPDATFCQGLLEIERRANPDWASFLGTAALASRSEEADVSRAAGVLANSEFTARSFADYAVPVLAVPLAVDAARLAGAGAGNVPVRSRESTAPFRVLYAGQISQRKGLSYLAEAMCMIDGGPVELTLVGSDSLGMVASLRASFPTLDLKHVDRVPQERLWEIMRDSHVFAFPTLLDGFGNALAEAAALGLPSIVTDRCGATDLGLLPDAAILVDAGSSNEISRALTALVRDEEARLRRGQHAAMLMSGGRTWADYGRDAADALGHIQKAVASG